MILQLIDADILCYQATLGSREYYEDGFVLDKEIVEQKLEESIHIIFNTLEEKYGYTTTDYKLFLSGSGNFRKLLNKEYKANRKDKQLPPLLDYARNYLIENHNAFVTAGNEADDAIVSTFYEMIDSPFIDLEKDLVIISSLDKDFQTIPCVLFDTYHTRMEIRVINKLTADRFFYRQLLEGDQADNVKCIPKVGAKTAEKILLGTTTEFGLRRKVYQKYLDTYGNKARREYEKNHLMLYMRRDVATPKTFETV